MKIKQHLQEYIQIKDFMTAFLLHSRTKTMYVYMNAKMYTSICVYEYL